MISADYLPHDPALPQLAAVLDAERMAREFAARLANRCIIRDLAIERVKYKPGKNCLVCYRLQLHDPRTGRSGEQWLSGRIFPAGGSLSRFQRARQQPLLTPAFGPPLWHLEALEMLVWAFPNERKLSGLTALTDPVRLRREFLLPIVQARWGDDWQIAELRPAIVHYAPEYTCSARVDLTLRQRQTGATHPWVIYGKTYYDAQGARTWEIMQQLWRRQSEFEFTIPQPLGYQPHDRLLWQEGLSGRTLQELYPESPVPAALLTQVACSVAALHRTALVCGALRVQKAALVERLQHLATLLGTARPALRETLERLVERLARQAPSLNAAHAATLHGDLYAKNILVDGARVALLDLDAVASGPPLHDIGSWIAASLYRACLQGQPLDTVTPALAAFVHTYQAHVPWPVPRAELAWYSAAALLNERRLRCLRRLKAGRLELIDELVRLAERISLRGLWT